MNFKLGVTDLEFGGYFMAYEVVDSDGRMIAFKGGAEKSLNGRTITWTVPDELNMNGSGVIPDFKFVSEQLEQCVPYVEFVNSGLGRVKYRLVTYDDTETVIHPNYTIDLRIYVYTKDGESFLHRK